MSQISHADITRFAGERVNLPSAKANEHRAQVKALRDRLTAKIDADPGFDLRKMLHSGSVAKGTALKSVNDLDVAAYVTAGSAPKEDHELQSWLAARLREANPNMSADQFVPQDHCVTVQFRGSGLDVDVVPVLYEGDPNDFGYLVREGDGVRVLTSIPLHLKFFRDRKALYGDNYRQLIRLTKYWKKQVAWVSDPDLRFKSFLIELIWAHLADSGVDLSDYPTALEQFFMFIVKGGLGKRIAFTDNYPASKLPSSTGAAIEVFDPVNPNNNVAASYTLGDRSRIEFAAQQAFDALSDARFCTTKGDAVEAWQDVLGPAFKG